MKSFKQFLESLSEEEKIESDKEMNDALPELNGLPEFICMSKDPNDKEALKIVIEDEEIYYRLGK